MRGTTPVAPVLNTPLQCCTQHTVGILIMRRLTFVKANIYQIIFFIHALILTKISDVDLDKQDRLRR